MLVSKDLKKKFNCEFHRSQWEWRPGWREYLVVLLLLLQLQLHLHLRVELEFLLELLLPRGLQPDLVPLPPHLRELPLKHVLLLLVDGLEA